MLLQEVEVNTNQLKLKHYLHGHAFCPPSDQPTTGRPFPVPLCRRRHRASRKFDSESRRAHRAEEKVKSYLVSASGAVNCCWLVVWNMAFIFPFVGNNSPDSHIFQRGLKPPTRVSCRCQVPFRYLFGGLKVGTNGPTLFILGIQRRSTIKKSFAVNLMSHPESLV